MWPAASILIGAVVMLLIFLGINTVFDSGVSPTTTTPVVVGGLPLDSGNSALAHYCNYDETIPSNIVGGLILPTNTKLVSGSEIPNQGAGDFSCSQPFVTTSASSGALLAFYRTHLEALGWSLFSQGASNGAPQMLFQKAGNDSFYWIIGVTVTSTKNSSVSWTLKIYQNSETI
jgi:hypothetical protein